MKLHKSISFNVFNGSRFNSSPHNLTITITTVIILTIASLAVAVLHQNFLNSPKNAHAADTPTSEACFATTGTETITITDYYDYEGNDSDNPACPRDVVIPDTIAGLPVTAVRQYGMSNKGLTSLVIPSTLTPGSYNFSYNQITEIVIPEGIESIGGGAFRGNRISSVSLPSTLKSIGDRAFTDNFYISEIDLPDELTYIGPRAFWGNALTEITIPASVTTIAAEAFWNNYNTHTIVFEGDDIPSIGADAFWTSQLQTIQHKDTTFSYGDPLPPSEQCFYFDDGIISGYKSFSFDNLREGGDPCMRKNIMTIPESIDGIEVNHIASHAFSYSNLSQVNLPESLVSIEDYAFAYNSIESVVIPIKVEVIGNYAFAGNLLESIVIENSNTIDQGSSWSSNSNLSSFIISGQTYTPIMGGLDCIEFDSESQTITGYEPPSHTWPSITSATNGTWINECDKHLIIPNAIDGITVLAIDDYAFEYAGLESVVIPESVTSIGDGAFYRNQLTSVTIPNSVASIGNEAFFYNQITNLTVPSSVTTFGSNVFGGEDNTLETLSVDMVDIPYRAFYNRKIVNLTLGPHVVSIGDQAFLWNKIASLTIPSSVKTIGEWAFQHNDLTSLVIPSSVTSISKYAFSINKLEEVTIPSSLTSIGEGVFWRNYLETVTIPSSVTTLEHAAFQENSLKTVYIEGNPTYALGTFNMNGLDRSAIPEDIPEGNNTLINQYYHDNSSMVHIYSDNADFINAQPLMAAFVTRTAEDVVIVTGGRIFNPTQVTGHYLAKDGTVLADPAISISTDPSITDYKIAQFIDNSTSTPTVMQSKVDTFYHIGDEATLTAPTIAGYITPAPHTLILSEPINEHIFAYKPVITEVPFKDKKAVSSGEMVEGVAPLTDTKHPLITNSQLILPETSTCQTVSEAKLLSPTALGDNQTVPDNITLLGGLDFTLDYCDEGSETDVIYTLGQKIDDTSALRVYKHNSVTDETQDITDLITFTTADDGNTTISYSLTDGGELDQDGIANGQIVDPIYVGMITSALSQLEGTGDTNSIGGLASTGMNTTLLMGVGGVMLLGGAVLLVVRRHGMVSAKA